MVNFPDFCIRGIVKKSYIYEDTETVSAALFIPDSRTRVTRSDEGTETSINWDDNDKVLEFTLQTRDEKNQAVLAFPHGAIKLPRHVLDDVVNLPSTFQAITYERQEIDNNPYHGNIVFRAGIPQHTINMIANVLAAHSSRPYRSDT